jgi:hypothetical protein
MDNKQIFYGITNCDIIFKESKFLHYFNYLTIILLLIINNYSSYCSLRLMMPYIGLYYNILIHFHYNFQFTSNFILF